MRAALTVCQERVEKSNPSTYYERWWNEWMATREQCNCRKSSFVSCLVCHEVFDEATVPEVCMGSVACPSCGAVTSQKADVTGETPPADDKFIDEETALAAVLLLAFNGAVVRYDVLARLVRAAASGNLTDVSLEASSVSDDLAKSFDDAEIKDNVTTILDKTFKRGLEVAGALSALAVLLHSRNRFNRQIVDSVRYYTNQYFRRIVAPSLMDELTRHVTSLTGSDDLQAVLKAHLQTGLFESEPYWRIVANQDVSRSHHYGMLRGMEERGYVFYRFVAVLDNRTTKLCRSLDGTTFRVADGINHLENIASADPEQVRNIAPWVSAADVAGQTSAQLTAMGVCVPPLHANCRSTLMVAS